MNITKNVGFLTLGIWLLITGLAPLLHFSFSGYGTIMALLAVVSGVFTILGR